MFKDSILLIGGGTMGEIVLQGLLKNVSPDTITIGEMNTDRAQYLEEEYSITALPTTSEHAKKAGTIILAVKPQNVTEVAEIINAGLNKQLIISVMAGVSTNRLSTLFKSKRVIRTMPNTLAKIGLGMTVWTDTVDVSDEEREFVTAVLEQFGKTLYVDTDDDIDKATAVNGSGPAYVFLFAEHLITAAKELGLDEMTAQLLVEQTLRGAGELLSLSKEPANELRSLVTSKGGTTEAAITSLPQEDLQAAWTQALQAAYARAKELND